FARFARRRARVVARAVRAVDASLPTPTGRGRAGRTQGGVMTVRDPRTATRSVITLTRMRWWHIEEILPIESDLFGEEQWSAPMFWSELAAGHHYVVALDDQGCAVGYAGLAVAPPDQAWVQNLAVRRDRQRAGVGRTLLEALLAEARRRAVRSVLLE